MNCGLRDVGKADPSKEVEGPTASPELNRKSQLQLPVAQNPYNACAQRYINFITVIII